MIVNDICRVCGGKCCQGFVSGKEPCQHVGSTGCTLTRDNRHSVCNVYPFIIVEDLRFPNSHRVFLDTGCPYWQAFVGMRSDIPDDEEFSLYIPDNKVKK